MLVCPSREWTRLRVPVFPILRSRIEELSWHYRQCPILRRILPARLKLLGCFPIRLLLPVGLRTDWLLLRWLLRLHWRRVFPIRFVLPGSRSEIEKPQPEQ